MCLVIDTCCLAIVFDGDNKKHDKFIPVLKWITEGRGRMIYGGQNMTLNLEELQRFLVWSSNFVGHKGQFISRQLQSTR